MWTAREDSQSTVTESQKRPELAVALSNHALTHTFTRFHQRCHHLKQPSLIPTATPSYLAQHLLLRSLIRTDQYKNSFARKVIKRRPYQLLDDFFLSFISCNSSPLRTLTSSRQQDVHSLETPIIARTGSAQILLDVAPTHSGNDRRSTFNLDHPFGTGTRKGTALVCLLCCSDTTTRSWQPDHRLVSAWQHRQRQHYRPTLLVQTAHKALTSRPFTITQMHNPRNSMNDQSTALDSTAEACC